MYDVPPSVRDAFYLGQRGPGLTFCVEDAVIVVQGSHEGREAAMISIESVGEDPEFLVEFTDGDDAILPASFLRLISG